MAIFFSWSRLKYWKQLGDYVKLCISGLYAENPHNTLLNMMETTVHSFFVVEIIKKGVNRYLKSDRSFCGFDSFSALITIPLSQAFVMVSRALKAFNYFSGFLKSLFYVACCAVKDWGNHRKGYIQSQCWRLQVCLSTVFLVCCSVRHIGFWFVYLFSCFRCLVCFLNNFSSTQTMRYVWLRMLFGWHCCAESVASFFPEALATQSISEC